MVPVCFLQVEKCVGSRNVVGSRKTFIDPTNPQNSSSKTATLDAKEEACGSINFRVHDWDKVFQYHNLFAFIWRVYMSLDFDTQEFKKRGKKTRFEYALHCAIFISTTVTSNNQGPFVLVSGSLHWSSCSCWILPRSGVLVAGLSFQGVVGFADEWSCAKSSGWVGGEIWQG